jgi:hypothetical protein
MLKNTLLGMSSAYSMAESSAAESVDKTAEWMVWWLDDRRVEKLDSLLAESLD